MLQDYFITTRSGVERLVRQMPDFVIGRAGFDNWLVCRAIKGPGWTVIDASRTVTARHQVTTASPSRGEGEEVGGMEEIGELGKQEEGGKGAEREKLLMEETVVKEGEQKKALVKKA